MEKDIGYKLIKSINLCFIYIQFFHQIQIFGFNGTNKERLLLGIEKKLANSILIKPNQIGTVTETLDTIKLAKEYGYETIVSHRSGETEDTFISDLACGINIEKVKFGAPCRTDRICKYNRLLEIENDLLK